MVYPLLNNATLPPPRPHHVVHYGCRKLFGKRLGRNRKGKSLKNACDHVAIIFELYLGCNAPTFGLPHANDLRSGFGCALYVCTITPWWRFFLRNGQHGGGEMNVQILTKLYLSACSAFPIKISSESEHDFS